MIKNHWHRRQSDHCSSAVALKLGLKDKQMDVVMGIVSERDVFIKRCEKSLLGHRYGRLPYTYNDEALYHKFKVSRRYSQDATEIQ